MMSRVQLEVFHLATPTPASDIVVLGKLELEETRLSAFDKGYAAGWDDAASALATEQTRIEADASRNLQSLGFTFHEARVHLLRGLRPLLVTMMGRLLPDIARETLGELILDALMPQAVASVDAPAMILVHPRVRAHVDGLLTLAKGMPFQVVEDPDLEAGQVYLRFHTGDETLIDLDRAIAQIMATVRDFFDQPDQERQYG